MADLKSLMVAALKHQLETNQPVTLPAGGEFLWSWFIDLNRTRTIGPAGAEPIRWGEMLAYSALRRVHFEQHHIDILTAMDAAYLSFVAMRQGVAPPGVKTMPPISKRSISASLLDAMMG